MKCGKRLRSSAVLISWAGFQPAFLAQSSQNGVPVSGEKCQPTISRTWASRRVEWWVRSDIVLPHDCIVVFREILVDRCLTRWRGEQGHDDHDHGSAQAHRHDGKIAVDENIARTAQEHIAERGENLHEGLP